MTKTHTISDGGGDWQITTMQKLRLQKHKLIYYCPQCRVWHLEDGVTAQQINKVVK